MEYRGGRIIFLALMPPDNQNYTTINAIYHIAMLDPIPLNTIIEWYLMLHSLSLCSSI